MIFQRIMLISFLRVICTWRITPNVKTRHSQIQKWDGKSDDTKCSCICTASLAVWTKCETLSRFSLHLMARHARNMRVHGDVRTCQRREPMLHCYCHWQWWWCVCRKSTLYMYTVRAVTNTLCRRTVIQYQSVYSLEHRFCTTSCNERNTLKSHCFIVPPDWRLPFAIFV